MVGFLRKKKSDKTMLSFDTALDRKGKIDGASLLDGNGDPTSGSLYDMRHPNARRNSNQENPGYDPNNNNAAANSHTYPPPYPQPMQYGGAFQQQPPQQQQQQYPVPAAMHTGFGNANAGYPRQYGAHQQQQQPQQYPVRYGAHQQQQSYGAPQNTYGAPQYPVQYGNYPPPMQPEAPKKSSFFRIPGMSKKN